MSGSRMGAVRGRRYEPAAGLESLCPHGPSVVPHAGTVFLFHASPLPAGRGLFHPGPGTHTPGHDRFENHETVSAGARCGAGCAPVGRVDRVCGRGGRRHGDHPFRPARPRGGRTAARHAFRIGGRNGGRSDAPALVPAPIRAFRRRSPDMECASHLISATFDDGHLFVESGTPDWLAEAHARGAASLLLAPLREYGKGE